MPDIFDLDRKLDRLIDGDATAAADSLTETAAAVAALHRSELDPCRKQEMKSEFLAKAAEMHRLSSRATTSRAVRRGWRDITARKVAALAAVLVMSSGTTVYASSAAMPDSPLYGVKRAAERAALLLAPAGLETRIRAGMARERVEEARYMDHDDRSVPADKPLHSSPKVNRNKATKADIGSGDTEASKRQSPGKTNDADLSASDRGAQQGRGDTDNTDKTDHGKGAEADPEK